MWRFSDAELNWVRTKIRFRPACRALLIGMSISRYLPPIGTAGFDRMSVSGYSCVPRSPPGIRVRTSFMHPVLVRPPARRKDSAPALLCIHDAEYRVRDPVLLAAAAVS